MCSQKKFEGQLAVGSKWADYVADYLNSKGVLCEATPMRIAQPPEEIKEFTQTDKDITFTHLPGNLEVKSRNHLFSNIPRNYPYGSIFVDTVSGWEQKQEKPIAVVSVSQINGCMLVCPADTYSTWKKIERFDKYRGYSDVFYTVEKEHLKPMSWLVEKLLKEQEDTSDSHNRVGKHMYAGGKDGWWISTKIVSIEGELDE
jgi:hypothetical protein